MKLGAIFFSITMALAVAGCTMGEDLPTVTYEAELEFELDSDVFYNESVDPAALDVGAEQAGDEVEGLCGTGLYCSFKQKAGASACKQYPGGPTIYCCPPGQKIYGDECR